MKRLFTFLLAFLFSAALMAQPILDIGLKAGLNSSKVKLDAGNFDSESVVKAHIGAFGRIGWSRMYLQPEIYYSAKGGKVIRQDVDPIERASQFDFSTVDVPVLVGVKLLKSGPANLRAMAGPVFCLMTSQKLDAGELLDEDYYRDHYFGFQYGIGVDFLSFFVDLRMEHAANRFYYQPGADIEGKNRTFMITAGFKIL